MTTLQKIGCKDCGIYFYPGAMGSLSDNAAEQEADKRCPSCRSLHRREIRAIAVSHSTVRQISATGSGGLSSFDRRRPEVQTHTTEPDATAPPPIEQVIGTINTPGLLLHNLIHRIKPVSIVVGPTGSGKSTWLPFRLLKCEELLNDGPVVVTQPRIAATEKVVKRVAELYYGEPTYVGPGLDIGYQHSQSRETTDRHNRLIFKTDGSLLNEVLSGAVRRYSTIMIDEAHERSVNIDTILALLRERMPLFPRLRLLIASATFDADTFLEYFGGSDQVALYRPDMAPPEILEIYGDEAIASFGPPESWETVSADASRWLPALRYDAAAETLIYSGEIPAKPLAELKKITSVNESFAAALDELSQQASDLPSLLQNSHLREADWEDAPEATVRVTPEGIELLMNAAVRRVQMICARDERRYAWRLSKWQRRAAHLQSVEVPALRGHILVFLHGAEEIQDVVEQLRKKLADTPNRIVPFHAQLDERERSEALSGLPPGSEDRLIIVATNAAETSLTLDGLVYVIDSGIVKQDYWSRHNRQSTLKTVLHSQAGCRQRIGRTGRTGPGEAYRLYTRQQLSAKHPAFTPPQLARTNLEDVLLKLSAGGFSFSSELRWLEAPPPPELDRARGVLRTGGWVDGAGDLTAKGEELLRLSADSHEAQLLLEADRFCCLPEAATVLAFASNTRCWAEAPNSKLKEPRPCLLDLHATDLLSTVETRNHLLSQCKDDAELYLRLWDQWENTTDVDRVEWACKMAVSANTFHEIDRKRQRLLSPFLDPDKGDAFRRVSGRRLDVLRLAATRAFSEALYRLDPAAGIIPLNPESEGKDPSVVGYEFHPTSVASKLDSSLGAFIALNSHRIPTHRHHKYRAIAQRGHVWELGAILRFDMEKWDIGKIGLVDLAVQVQSFAVTDTSESSNGMPPLEVAESIMSPTTEQRARFLAAHADPNKAIPLIVEEVRVLTSSAAAAFRLHDTDTGISFWLADFNGGLKKLSEDDISQYLLDSLPCGIEIALKLEILPTGAWGIARSFSTLSKLDALVTTSAKAETVLYMPFATAISKLGNLVPGAVVQISLGERNDAGRYEARFDSNVDPWLEVQRTYPVKTVASLRVYSRAESGLTLVIGNVKVFLYREYLSLIDRTLEDFPPGSLMSVLIDSFTSSPPGVRLFPVSDSASYNEFWRTVSPTLSAATVLPATVEVRRPNGAIIRVAGVVPMWINNDKLLPLTLDRIDCGEALPLSIAVSLIHLSLKERWMVVRETSPISPDSSKTDGAVSEIRSPVEVLPQIMDTGAETRPADSFPIRWLKLYSGDFQRAYFEDVLLDDNELRGLAPRTLLRATLGEGIHVRFSPTGISLESTTSCMPIRVHDSLLTPGQMSAVPSGATVITIGTLSVTAEVMEECEVPLPPSTSPDAIPVFRIRGLDNFSRVYYEDVFLDRVQLRGASPREAVRELSGTGVWVHFQPHGVTVRPVRLAPLTAIDNRAVSEFESGQVPFGRSTLRIGDLEFQTWVNYVSVEGEE